MRGSFERPLAAAFLFGIFANLSQVALLRFLLGTFSGTEIHLGVFLGLWLTGISVGGCAGMIWLPSPKTLCAFLVFMPWAALLGLPSLLEFFPIVQGGLYSLGSLMKVSSVIILPPSLMLGWLIPSLVGHYRCTLGSLYGIEAMGSFAGGVLFSLVLEGRVSATLTLAVVPVLCLAALAVLSSKSNSHESGSVTATQRSFFGLQNLSLIGVCILPLILVRFAPQLIHQQEHNLWKLLHPGLTLKQTLETPYQQALIGEYEGQFSLFTDGALSGAWPDYVRAEEKVHTFMTAISSPSRVLLFGCPTPDFLEECLKYPTTRYDIVDLDEDLMVFLASGTPVSERIQFIAADPRQFARTSIRKYDGILLLPSDPVSLLSNRLFTSEAFDEFSRLLNPGGVLSFTISGTENYLGDELEQVLLSTWQTISRVFPSVFAIPGDPITFWCAGNQSDLITSPEALQKRFSDRSIRTLSFSPFSFNNLLLPFRLRELQQWLHRPRQIPPNVDSNPIAFIHQLRLWNVYSSSGLGGILALGARLEFSHLAGFMGLGFVLLLFIGSRLSTEGKASLAVYSTVGISGAIGILAELVLIFVYQVRQGALFKMMGFFFGLYMLGLALGAFFAQHTRKPRKSMFLRIKAGQAGALLFGIPAIFGPAWMAGVCTGVAIFFIALLDGFEFSVLDQYLREHGVPAARSAGALMLSDNGGAVLTALISGPILLPTLGMAGALAIAFLALSGNASVLAFTLPETR